MEGFKQGTFLNQFTRYRRSLCCDTNKRERKTAIRLQWRPGLGQWVGMKEVNNERSDGGRWG
jgi:hypothetical protein